MLLSFPTLRVAALDPATFLLVEAPLFARIVLFG